MPRRSTTYYHSNPPRVMADDPLEGLTGAVRVRGSQTLYGLDAARRSRDTVERLRRAENASLLAGCDTTLERMRIVAPISGDRARLKAVEVVGDACS